MKNLLVLCFFLVISFATKAQQKPSKEETLAFMNRTLEYTIGFEFDYVNITATSFDLTNYSYKAEMVTENVVTGNFVYKYSQIKWEYLLNNEFELQSCNVGHDKVCEIWIYFSKPMIFRKNATFKYEADEEQAGSTNCLRLVIPKEKYESVKKACLRLAEIAKEENKDPFSK